MENKDKKYVIGVDGGGTKTTAVLVDLNGKILKIAKSGPSNLRNVGIKKAVKNIAEGIKMVLSKKGKILSTFIGLAAVEEEFKFKKEKIKKELLKYKKISPIFKGKITINSDQIVAFRSGTDEKYGVVLIAGTGCSAHGWRNKIEVKTTGWGWLADEGGGFWVGQRVFQIIFKNLDGRNSKTLLTKLIFQKLKIKTKEDLITLVYSENPTEIIPSFSVFCDEASEKGDKIAKEILIEAGKELALSVNTIIKKLNFQKIKFPLVLIGSMFKSKIVLNTVKKEIKRFAPKAQFIRPKQEPVIGAVKLAIEQVKNK